MKNKIDKHVAAFKALMNKITIRIFSYDETGKMINRSSGFLYQPTPQTVPLVITAGHHLPEQGGFIETNIIENGQVLQIVCGKFHVFYNHDDIDYAFSQLPVKAYLEILKIYEDIDLICYRHEFVNAMKGEAYGFSVLNNYEAARSSDQVVLHLYECAEVGLELIEQTEHLNYFKPVQFQGDEFYKGASGSPIADPEGIICAILIGGTEDGLLRAARLDNITDFPTPITVFTDDADCISKVSGLISNYPNIDSMVIMQDYNNWQRLLTKAGGYEVYWDSQSQKLNLLLTAMVAYCNTVIQTKLTTHTLNILEKLDNWLSVFQELTKDKNFKGKIKNLDGFNFLSSLSELTLGNYFAQAGYKVAFESKFRQTEATARKDVDVTVQDSSGKVINFEVFMPNNETDLNGFFDPSDRDGYFTYKVWKKMEDKFGTAGFSGLTGKTYLAVNYAFFDEFYRNSLLPIFSNQFAFESLSLSLPAGVDGILFFRDDFSVRDSFFYDTLIERVPHV